MLHEGDPCQETGDHSTTDNEQLTTNMPRTYTSLILLFAFFLPACHDDHAHEGSHPPHASAADSSQHTTPHGPDANQPSGPEASTIAMSPAAVREAGIVVQAVTKDRLTTTLTLPGRVVPTQNGIAHVGTIVPGRVRRLMASEGSYVRRGEALAEIEVYDIGVVKGELMEARADVEQRRAALDRQERLGKEGIGAQRAIEEARAAYKQAVARQTAAESRLRAAGINPSSVRAGNFSSVVQLRAPISGVVSRSHVVLGEYLEPSKDAFEVMNTSIAWIDAQAQPAQATTIATGDPGFVTVGDQRRSGRIIFVSPTVDPESRTVTVRVEVDNNGLRLRSDMFVNVEFEQSTPGWGLVIPQSAIEMESGTSYVYLQEEPNAFIRVPVETGERMGDRVVITGGLRENSRVVVKGIFYIRSARMKGELEEEHHHQ